MPNENESKDGMANKESDHFVITTDAINKILQVAQNNRENNTVAGFPYFDPDHSRVDINKWCDDVKVRVKRDHLEDFDIIPRVQAALLGRAKTWYTKYGYQHYSWTDLSAALIHAFSSGADIVSQLRVVASSESNEFNTYADYVMEKVSQINRLPFEIPEDKVVKIIVVKNQSKSKNYWHVATLIKMLLMELVMLRRCKVTVLTFDSSRTMRFAGWPSFGATSMAANVDREWWRHAVFYQIYPRSFMDSNGDGLGDLPGITQKLAYLADTGISATWLSPIFKSPMKDFGYDISDFKAIQEEYGTMEDFEELITEATRLGIKLILDFVPNHTSDKCDWFIKSVEREPGYEDFYIWADAKLNEAGEREPPNNWQSVFYGSAWEWNDIRQQYYLHQFTIEQPDLNYRNPNVVEAMDDVLRFWLNKGVSGFRVDAVNHMFEVAELTDEPLSGKTSDKFSYDYTEHIYTKNLPEVYDMLQHWRMLLDDYSETHGGPERIMLTEAYAPLKILMDYYETENGLRGSQVPFNFYFITDLHAQSDARDFVYNIQKWLTYMPPGGEHVANWVMGNHDNPRVASRFGSERVDALNMLLMTLPGVAVTYNGEELGMQDYRDMSWEQTLDPAALNVGTELYKNFSRDPVRTPFQWDNTANAGFSTAARTWLPVHPDYEQLNLAAQMQSDKSHYKVYKDLVELRKNLPALKSGRLQAEVLKRQVFAIKRELRNEVTIVTIINLDAKPHKISLAEFANFPQKMTVLIAGTESSYKKGDTLNAAEVSLEPFEGLVCELS